MHRLQGAGNGDGVIKRPAERQAGAHARAQIAGSEILHHQPRVLIAHTQVEETDDARAADALNDLVLLQEAPEGIVEVAVLGVPVARDLQCHQLSSSLALAEIEVRHGSGCDASNMAITANKRAAEA